MYSMTQCILIFMTFTLISGVWFTIGFVPFGIACAICALLMLCVTIAKYLDSGE